MNNGSKYSLLVGPDSMNAISELLGLRVVRQLALHPDRIGIWSKGNSTVDGATAASLVSVVSLTGASRLPVEVDVHASQGLCNGSTFSVALALGGSLELLDEKSLVWKAAGIDSICNSLFEKPQSSFFHPLFLDSSQLIAKLASLLGGDHEIVEGFQVGVGGSLDECMVSRVNGGSDKGGSFRVGTSDGEKISSYTV